jgi:hypothetical protein
MEDIVAIRVKLTSGTSRYFLTWGEAAGSAQAHEDKAGESKSGQVSNGDPGFP